ncbi:OprD family porin [Pseudomonas sp. S31]|uniref:OprD family porin n=1 Tax=Pseudomonas sp. S31 TaxID=1564473 RepID=UPI002E291172|nr:OprD family porin [Pseudomonas sp. S31]MBK5000210.1 OprD family porin [Pseudomonas sp. S31]
MKTAVVGVVAVLGYSGLAMGSEQSESKGFAEGSSLVVKARNVYFNRDQRARGAEQSYGEEWAQGFIGTFQSGFTTGTVGVGFDALGLVGLRLDTGDGRTGGGTRLLEQDSSGAKPSYGSLGGAVKLRVSSTTLKYGTQIVNTPVLGMSDSRLLPETVQGLLVTSNELPGLKLQAGHFTALKLRNDSAHDSGNLPGIDLAGAVYDFNPNVQGSLYYSDVEDYWRKQYGGLVWTVPLSSLQAVKFDANLYRTRSQGEALGGDLDNRIWSLAVSYKTGAHTFMLARQQVHGRGDFKYGVEGNSAIYVANSSQYSDFIYEGEKSWQLRYNLDAAPYGIPGLAFMARYIRGSDFTTDTGRDGKAWERDLEVRYVVQSGAAKDLSFRVRSALYRSSDRGGDINEVVVTTEYPISIF